MLETRIEIYVGSAVRSFILITCPPLRAIRMSEMILSRTMNESGMERKNGFCRPIYVF